MGQNNDVHTPNSKTDWKNLHEIGTHENFGIEMSQQFRCVGINKFLLECCKDNHHPQNITILRVYKKSGFDFILAE